MKRKGENPSQENVEKRRKEQIPTENENYTHLNFKLELRDATTIFIALEKFIQQAKGYLEGVCSEDIAAYYCRSSPECQEIFQILEAGKRKPQEYALIFETLECMLLRFGDDLSNLKTVGHSLVRRLLAGHMGAIFSMLWPSNKASHIKASLKLLTSMVMLSDSTARDVQAQFDFTHQALPALLLRRNIQDPQDIRTCLLQFIMSFLNSGDSSVVRQLVEQKGFLNSIFFGMVNDRLSTVQLILGTLQEKVVLNPYISKTAKIRLFNDNILKQLLQLYKWKGPTKWKASQDVMEQEIEIEEDENEDRKVVREQVHSFLLEICCSIKTGINFYDKSIGTSGKNMNHVLTNFLVSITKPYEQPLIQELVVSVLTTCPDQLGRYLPTLQHHFVPRVSANWIAALEFLHKVYSVLPELSSFLKPTEHVPPQRLVAMAMTLTVPPAAIMNLITQAVKKPSPILRSAVLKLVLLITEKFQRNIASCTGGDGKSAWATYTAKDKQDFTESYTETMIKVLPSLFSIVKSWADLTGKSATESSQTVIDDDSDLVVDSDLAVKDVEIGVYMSRILQTFCCYQLNFPGLLSVYTIDFSSMLEGIKAREADLSLEEKSALQLHVLQLLANSDSRKVNWNKQSDKGRSMMYLLMEMVVTSAGNEELGELTKALLVKMLVNTGLFEDNEAELKLWLKRLETTPVNSQISVLTFLEKTALTLLSNPYPYADRIIEAVSKSAQMGQSNNDEMETGEDILKEILDLESIPLQVDGDVEENCQGSAQEVHTVERSPFSPLVPVALSLLPVKEQNAEVLEYLQSVLVGILHMQLDPKPLCLMLHQYTETLKMTTLCDYITQWLPQESKKTPGSPVRKLKKSKIPTDYCGLHQYIFERRTKTGLLAEMKKGSKKALSELTPEGCVEAVQQILLYIHTVVEEWEKDADLSTELLERYFDEIYDIIAKVHEYATTEERDTGPEKTEVKASNNAYILNIAATAESKEDILVMVMNLVLSHPTVKTWFLKPAVHHSHKDDQKRIAVMMTSFTCKTLAVIAEFEERFTEHLKGQLDMYIQELVTYICREKENLGRSSSSTMYNHLPSLLKFFSFSQQGMILDAILGQKKKSEETRGKHVDLVSHIIAHLSSTSSDPSALHLTIQSVSTLLNMAIAENSVTFDQILLKFFQAFPQYAVCASDSFVEYCFHEPTYTRVDMIYCLITGSNEARRMFIDCCKRSKKVKKMKQLFVKVMDCLLFMESEFEAFIKDLYMPEFESWLFESDQEQDETKYKVQMMIKLVHLLNQEEADQLVEKLRQIQCLSSVQIMVFHSLVKWNSAYENLSLKLQWQLALVENLVKSTTLVLSQKSERDNQQKEMLINILSSTIKEEAGLRVLKPYWNDFFKAALRHQFNNPSILKILGKVVGAVDAEKGEETGMMPLSAVYEMIVSHSQFLPTLLHEDPDNQTKDCLVDLMLSLVQRNGTCCKTDHIVVLLGAYSATLKTVDQKLLQLMHIYEENQASLKDFKPYLWGTKAIEHHSIKKSLGTSLFKQATVEQVLESLDVDMMHRSALNFPLLRKLQPLEVHGESDGKPHAAQYDPAFLLPVFSNLLGPENLVNCRKFVETNCLGFTFCALSSHDPTMRSAAYHVLMLFYQQLEGAKFYERNQVLYVLDCVRNSVETPNAKLCCMICVFLAKTVQLLLHPDEHMYQIINSFMLLKPTLDILNVPEFYKLFNSSAFEYKVERAWILQLLADGLRETADYRLCEKRYIFKLLLSFHDSAISDQAMQANILKIIHAACKVRSVAQDLVKSHGLLSWLSGIVKDSNATRQVQLVDIVYTLWMTILNRRDEMQVKPDGSSKTCLPAAFTSEVLIVLLHLLQNFRIDDDPETLLKYLQTLLSVLNHQRATCEQYASNQYHLTVVKIESHHVLKLLQVWGKYNKEEPSEYLETKHPFHLDSVDVACTSRVEEGLRGDLIQHCRDCIVGIIEHFSPIDDKTHNVTATVITWLLRQINTSFRSLLTDMEEQQLVLGVEETVESQICTFCTQLLSVLKWIGCIAQKGAIVLPKTTLLVKQLSGVYDTIYRVNGCLSLLQNSKESQITIKDCVALLNSALTSLVEPSVERNQLAIDDEERSVVIRRNILGGKYDPLETVNLAHSIETGAKKLRASLKNSSNKL